MFLIRENIYINPIRLFDIFVCKKYAEPDGEQLHRDFRRWAYDMKVNS